MATLEENEDLVQNFQNLQVFPTGQVGPFEMNSLFNDLNTAIEESSKATRKADAQKKHKRKLKKRRPSTTGQASECSDCSHEEKGTGTFGTTQASDSDDVMLSGNNKPAMQKGGERLSSGKHQYPFHLLAHTLSLAESDSFTENSPFRPHRRKRRFKRMAVDIDQDQSDFNVTQYLQEERMKRLQTFKPKGKSDLLRPPTPKRVQTTMSADDVPPSQDLATGVASLSSSKRKRGIKGSSSFEVLDEDTVEATATTHFCVSESSLSSSCESDATQPYDGEGVLGDDEQSDWFYEAGPVSGVPVIVPWWEERQARHSKERTSSVDTALKKFFSNSMAHMSASSQLNLQARFNLLSVKTGRPIRKGKRRLKDKKSNYSLTRFFEERQQWTDSQQCTNQCQATGTNTQDPKRRRKTPPVTPINDSAIELLSGILANHSENRLSWIGGNNQGADASGVTDPLHSFKRKGHKKKVNPLETC